MDRYVVIMAGGSGTRFWPKSRERLPKQLLSIFTGTPLVEDAVARAQACVDRDHVFVITTAGQLAQTREILGATLAPENVIAEPVGRDTAPCVALACARVALDTPDASLMVMPADHVIRPVSEFTRVANAGFHAAENHDALVTFGVPPTYPSTGYGYIAAGDTVAETDGVVVRRVKAFKEKPDVETARAFLEAGNYFWNSGIFVWRLATITEQFKRHAPAIAGELPALTGALGGDPEKDLPGVYERLEKISIDYAVMERADDVLVVETTYEWNDVGAWTSLAELLEGDPDGNVVCGRHVGIDSSNVVVFSEGDHLVATVGVKDLVIVSTSDATLVMRAEDAQRIKEVVSLLRERGHHEVL